MPPGDHVVDRSDRPLDLVVFGASSFVGRLVCEHLVERHGCHGPLRWAIAGRDGGRLAQVAERTGAEVELRVVDADDLEGLRALARDTRVVVSTVGPYALHGSPLVEAVVAEGTDYCDLTGETQWMRAMIDRHEVTAQRTGARVVHACGFDSIPSDLGVWFTQQAAVGAHGTPCTSVAMSVQSLRGGASGGTVASMLNLVEEAAADPEVRALLADPHALVPVAARRRGVSPDLRGPVHDPLTGDWLAPFVMAAVNTRVVHRTNALLGDPWGRDFQYREAMRVGAGPVAATAAGAVALGLAVGPVLLAASPVRGLARRFAPAPGTGPGADARASGSFDLRFTGTTRAGERVSTRVTGDRDPGYGSTARMFGEAALAMSETSAAEISGGFWTPASAFGARLVELLQEHAGLRFSVLG